MIEETRDGTAEKETGRVEAFSDGVFAVAITLLAFDVLKIPEAPEGAPFGASELFTALAHQWPIYLTFLTSFATILIMWMNHHAMFKLVQKTDGVFMLANGFLLLLVTLVPFPTGLLAQYLLTPPPPRQRRSMRASWSLSAWPIIYSGGRLPTGAPCCDPAYPPP
jgi:uncharacterized membrane protein